MDKKKKSLLIIGVFIMVVALTGVSLAFFNYTRTGTANTIQTGRIYFSSSQNNTIRLTNVFPIATKDVSTDTTNVGTVDITVTGDTMYTGGIEYLVSASNVNITTGSKTIPVSIDVSVDSLGNNSDTYWDTRRGSTNSIYKVLAGTELKGNDQLLVGYIAKGASGVSGTITIKAYLDADKIAISDTLENGPIVETGYVNGTTEEWVNGRVVLTTTEWNNLATTPISFQVRVEANEGIWVDKIETLGDKVISRLGNDGVVAINTSGALASGSDTIREYRYSGGGRYCSYENGGTTYNLQVEGNECPATVVFGGGLPGLYTPTADIAAYQGGTAPTGTTYTLSSDGVQEGTVKNYILFNNELWRIIGVFGDKVKIIKDVPIKTTDSFMTDSGTGVQYTALNNTTYMIKPNFRSSPMANTKYAPIYWNYDGTNYPNDWSNGGLQYWLNENNTGSYYNTIGAAYKSLIQEETYYLRNVNTASYGTASQAYDLERATPVECASSVTSNSHNNGCNIWNGNSSEWKGKIALPYPSDFGYAASSSYWTSTLNNYWNASNPVIQGDNWFLNNDTYYNWFLSPFSSNSRSVAFWGGAGYMFPNSTTSFACNYFAVRPVLNLESSLILSGGDGSYSSPYTLKLS